MYSQAVRPSHVLRERIAALRDARRWSQTQLADGMKASGHNWVRSTVAKIESGGRQVTVEELLALALVLGVPPIALLTPPTNTEIQLTAIFRNDSDHLWRWMGGLLDGTLVFPVGPQSETDVRKYDESFPDYVLTAEKRVPGLKNLLQLVSYLQYAVGTSRTKKAKEYASISAHAELIAERAARLAVEASELQATEARGIG